MLNKRRKSSCLSQSGWGTVAPGEALADHWTPTSKAFASQHTLSAYIHIQRIVRSSHAASVGTCSVYGFPLVECQLVRDFALCHLDCIDDRTVHADTKL